MANGNQQNQQAQQDTTLVSDEELFSIEDEEEKEQQSSLRTDEEVSDSDLFDIEEPQQTTQSVGGDTVSDESLFDQPATQQQQVQTQQPEEEKDKDESIFDKVVDAAKFFIPKEDPEGSASSVDFSKSRGWEQGVGNAIRMLGNVPEMFALQSQVVADLWNEAHQTQQMSDEDRRQQLLDQGLPEERVNQIIANRKRLRQDPEMQEKLESGRKAFQEIARGQQQSAERVEETIKNYARTWSKPTPSKLHEANDAWDYFEPNRLYDIFATQAPLTGFLGATYLANPYAGAALMYGVEGGATLDAIEKMEERGVNVDPTVKFMTTHAVGTTNMMLEKLGVDKMLGASSKAGLGRKVLNIGFGALTEGTTEALQEGNSAINEEIAKKIDKVRFDRSVIPDDLGERMIKGLYGGLVVGGGMSIASGTLGELAKPESADAEVVGFERDDQGTLVPKFRVTKPGHELEMQEVSLDEMQDLGDVKTPDFRLDMLVQQGKNAGLIKDEKQEYVFRTLIRARASKENVSADEWIFENIESIVSGSKVNKSDLLQEVNKSIAKLGNPIDEVNRVGNLPDASNDLRAVLLDGDGNLYIGEKGQDHTDISRDYGIAPAKTITAYINGTGNYVSIRDIQKFLRTDSPIASEHAIKLLEKAGHLTDPSFQHTPISERSLIGEEATDDLTRALQEAALWDRANNLRAWFENSKIVEDNGQPVVAYHGTRSDFNTFNRGKAKVTTDDGFYGEGYYFTGDPNLASYFAEQAYGEAAPNVMPVYLKITNPFEIQRETSAADITRELGIEDLVEQRLKEVPNNEDLTQDQILNALDDLTMEGRDQSLVGFIMDVVGPKRFREILVQQGYDGVIGPSTDNVRPNAKEYVAFTSNQVKSAIGNRGTFNFQNPNILLQTGFRGFGENVGVASEGHGLYVADSPRLAEKFGTVKEIEYDDPKNPIEADALFLAEGDWGTLKRMAFGQREANNAWWRAHKEAYKRFVEENNIEVDINWEGFQFRKEGKNIWDWAEENNNTQLEDSQFITNKIARHLTDVLKEEGYDAVRVPDNVAKEVDLLFGEPVKQGWTLLLDESLVEGGFEQYYQREGGLGEVKGAVDFSGGKAVIKAFDTADFTTMLHELGHVFRRSLNESELNEIMETLESDTEKGWTREAEEEFVDRFMEWAEGGEVTDSRLRRAFEKFRDWVIEVVGQLSDSDSISLSKEQEQFFNNMFDEIQDEINQIDNPSERFGALGRWFSKLYDRLDVESRFRKVGLSETGFHIKNYFSIQEVYTQEGIDLETEMGRLLGGDQDKQIEVILAAESPNRIDELRAEGKNDVADAAQKLRDYFDKSQAEYKARGAEGVDFKRRILSELDNKIRQAEEAGEVEKATELRNRFQEIQENFEFVGIPFQHWFQSEMKGNIDNALQLVELLATKYKRNTVKIADLLEEDIIDREDVTTRSIIESYSTTKAKDMALLNIRRAAIEEGGMIPIEQGQDYRAGYHRPPSGAIVFEGYQVRDVIGDWIRTQLVKNDELGAWKSFFNKVKMAAFWNPFFLPMYDVLQSTMSGATSFLRPIKTAKLYKDAMNDVLNRTDDFYAAEREGISSKPYNSPYEDIARAFYRASRSTVPEDASSFLKTTEAVKNYAFESLRNVLKEFGELQGMDWIKTLGGATVPLRAVYQTSWDTAWYLDRLVRQVTYRHFKEEGFNDREAAQKSAEAHADYASIPPKTRRTLNSVFFTPTFKIAMGKWFADSLRSIGNVMQGNANMSQKELAGAAVRGLGILVAYDMMMLSLGFERDEFGRRYVRPADTDKGLKELVVTWTGPHNLFLKYAQRIENATTDPSVTNVGKRLLQMHSWELHPVYRIGNSLINNSTPGGEKIYNSLDDDHTKLAKMATYAVNSSVALVAQLNEEQAFGKKGSQVFAREYGKLWEVITKPFIFKYTRQPKEVRIKNQVEMMKRIAEEEIGAQSLGRRILSSEKDADKVIKEFREGLEERARNFNERMRGIIDKLEEENYDRTNNPPIPQEHYNQDASSQDTNQVVPDSALFDQ